MIPPGPGAAAVERGRAALRPDEVLTGVADLVRMVEVDALDGRTVHALHVEGCGGGHSPDVPTDLTITRDRIRASMMGAENVLHDLGVIPITSSDAQGMGRAGETVRRTFGLAGVMKRVRGAGQPRHDNEQVLRFSRQAHAQSLCRTWDVA